MNATFEMLRLDISGATTKETLNYIKEKLPREICLKYEVGLFFFLNWCQFYVNTQL